MLRAFRISDGTEVRPGDMIRSDRSGDTWRFQYGTRPTTDHTAGKVMVNSPQYHNDGGAEIYASHFGIVVWDIVPMQTTLTAEVIAGRLRNLRIIVTKQHPEWSAANALDYLTGDLAIRLGQETEGFDADAFLHLADPEWTP